MPVEPPAGDEGSARDRGAELNGRAEQIRRAFRHRRSATKSSEGLGPHDVTAAFLCKYAYRFDAAPPPDFDHASGGVRWADVSAPLSGWRAVANDVTDAQAVCCRDAASGTTYVAFRGTESARDLASDLRVGKRPATFVGGERPPSVHAGFYDQYASIHGQVDDYLSANPLDAVVLTGHSLGGALATVCALYLAVKRPGRRVSATVFGSPRAGDARFSELVDRLYEGRPVRRHVFGSDPVASLPHRARWKHCGVSVRHRGPPARRSWRGPADSALRGWLTVPNPFAFPDHGIDNYIDAVCGLRPEGEPRRFF